jgi:hypothetical protein
VPTHAGDADSEKWSVTKLLIVWTSYAASKTRRTCCCMTAVEIAVIAVAIILAICGVRGAQDTSG